MINANKTKNCMVLGSKEVQYFRASLDSQAHIPTRVHFTVMNRIKYQYNKEELFFFWLF